MIKTPSAPTQLLLAVVLKRIEDLRRGCRTRLERPAEVHDLRVAIRRLQVALSILRDPVGESRGKTIDAELRWLLRKLALVREWDVLRAEFAKVVGKRTSVANRLAQDGASHRRKQAARKARHALRSVYVIRLGEQLARTENRLKKRADRVDAAQVLSALHRHLDKVHRQASSVAPDDTRALHRLRLDVKTLRYASELVLDLYPPSDTAAFYATLRRAQECLGSAQDAAVERSLIDRLPRSARLPARALMGSVDCAKTADKTYPVATCLSELQALGAFWLAQSRLGICGTGPQVPASQLSVTVATSPAAVTAPRGPRDVNPPRRSSGQLAAAKAEQATHPRLHAQVQNVLATRIEDSVTVQIAIQARQSRVASIAACVQRQSPTSNT